MDGYIHQNMQVAHYACADTSTEENVLNVVRKCTADIVVLTFSVKNPPNGAATIFRGCAELDWFGDVSHKYEAEWGTALRGVQMVSPHLFVLYRKDKFLCLNIRHYISRFQHIGMLEFEVLPGDGRGKFYHGSSGGSWKVGLIAVNSEDPEFNRDTTHTLQEYLSTGRELGATYAVGVFGGARDRMKDIARTVHGLPCELLACERLYDEEHRAVCFPSYIFSSVGART